MAKQNIVVAENGIKVVLFPRSKDAGKRVELSEAASEKVRKHVQAYCENDSRDLPYHDRLSKNARVGLKGNNAMLPAIRSIMKEDASQDFDADLAKAQEQVRKANAERKQEQQQARQEKKEAFMQQQVASNEPSIEDIMAEAEALNAKMDLISKVKRSNLPQDAKQQVLALIG